MNENTNTTANTTANAIAKALTLSLNGKKGQMGITAVYCTEPKMRKTNNPFFGRVTKLTTAKNARFGISYENAVNGKLERNGIDPDFKAQKSVTEFVNSFINESKDGTKKYLKLGANSATKFDSVFFVDGNIATSDEMAEIDKFLQKSTPSQRQIDAGLSPEECYIHITINVENIVSITQGNIEIYHRDNSIELSTAK